MARIVYFSSQTNNTHRFVEKLGYDAVRIPIHGETPVVDEPYVLICPT
ncbi:class Ib ribonucleoside-diphosphate reductase assembly flavoprotein NrdI, partial [Streptococcus anginosus]|nr:class Ib ribonucleoside-diphosphate reductase assembly flavoprotein NrdI [Streptococcus anginosus]